MVRPLRGSMIGSRIFSWCVQSPLLEETIYRVVLCVSAINILGRTRTVLLSGVLFAALHFVYGNPSPDNALAGFVLGWAHLKSETIVVPVLMHAGGNLAVLGMMRGAAALSHWSSPSPNPALDLVALIRLPFAIRAQTGASSQTAIPWLDQVADAVFPRLHVLLARDSPRSVVIRRGPTRHTATVLWDRATDSFTLGQWLKGRIYERRSDLSPDGEQLIYFAMNGRWSSNAKGAWTAISRAPFLKAVSLFAKGDCWHGGGLFQSAQDYWLNDGYGHETQREDPTLRRVHAHPWHDSYGGECLGVYFIRLQRDGWEMKGADPDGKARHVTVFEKKVKENWILRKLAHAGGNRDIGKGIYFDTHALINTASGQTIAKDHWEWADIDRNRLVWAATGCIHTGYLDNNGLAEEKVLYDFRLMTFERVTAPY